MALQLFPVYNVGYANVLLRSLLGRPRSVDGILADHGDALFPTEPDSPVRRLEELARLAERLGLLTRDDVLDLTPVGREYADAAPSEGFDVTEAQAEVLRRLTSDHAATSLIYRTAAVALRTWEHLPAGTRAEDFGRELAIAGQQPSWTAKQTFVTQGRHWTSFLRAMRVLDDDHRLTEEGRDLLSLLPAGGGSASSVRVWLNRAGEAGEHESLALDHDVSVIGWHDLGRLDPALSRDDLKVMIRETYGETRTRSLANQAGQIYRFIHDVSVNDLVVLPLKTRPGKVAVGRVAGDYEFRDDGPFEGTDAQNTRRVEWLAKDLDYDRFDPDLREAFGQQGTLSEITKPNAAQRILDVLGGADASAIHLVLKWSPTIRPDTIERHEEVAAREGAVWWGRQSRPGTTGLARDRLAKLHAQLERGSETLVFLYSSAGTWKTRLLAITTDAADVEKDLIPTYYDPDQYQSLWVKLADFQQVDPSEITEGYVLAQSGDPVTGGGLSNQTPLIIRRQAGMVPGRYFILNQSQTGGIYDDAEGERYHWTSKSSGAWKQLANSPGARFVYYRPGQANDGTTKSYFGTGRIASITRDERDGLEHFVAEIDDFESFEHAVPFQDGPSRNAQVSIQPITRIQYDRLVRGGAPAADSLDVGAVREAAEKRGLSLSDDIYAQLVAALTSGKHVILTGPPGTAKTTLAQIVAETASAASLCDGYVLTTATADWTTYETIGGLRPTGANTLEFEEGHFLKAIRAKRWLVIDELNRSQFDRAFGQLFTVLSGQAVVLPYHRPDRPHESLALVPEGAETPGEGLDVLEIPLSWRVIATMNVFDKSLLFEMSFALMRRFAFIEVASPSEEVFHALIDREASGEAKPAALTKELLALRHFKDLGPAVFMDLARFLRERLSRAPAGDGQLIFEGFYSYLLPQFEGIDGATGEKLFDRLASLVGTKLRERLRRTLNAVLGLEIPPPAVSVSDDPEAEQLEEEPGALEEQ
jgi:MoxR-like ATPase